ncbi:MAG: phospholipid carrier-dependent glycosyltransferase, partial [Pyrinomonadaceae bacterium]
MQHSTLAKRAWLLLLLAACAVYFYGLGRLPLVGPDEPRYAQVAREMFLRGDWVTPTLSGHTWFEKPALLYWMMMAAYGAFGVSEWAARLGSAFSGVLTVLLVGWLGRRVERVGGAGRRGLCLAATAVAATSAGMLVFSRAASFDVIVTMTVTLSLACFFVAELERAEGRRRLLLAGFYAGMGASLLAKGLIGVVIPAGIVALYFLLRRRWPGLLRIGLHWGPLLVLAVAAVWYAPVIARHGREFVDEFFVQHHFARYVSNKYKHPQPFYFYVPIMALLALPWTAFLVAGVGGAWRSNWRADEEANKLRVFALAWVVMPVVFFSLSGSKLPGYIL